MENFRLHTLKTTFWMKNLNHIWTQSGFFPQKLGLFFSIFNRGRGDLPPPLLIAYLTIGININNLWISHKIFVIVYSERSSTGFNLFARPLKLGKTTIFSRNFIPPHYSLTSTLFYVKDSIVIKYRITYQKLLKRYDLHLCLQVSEIVKLQFASLVH